jgi:hypothetical protein
MDAPLLFPTDGSTKVTNKYRVAPVPETLMKTRTSAGVASSRVPKLRSRISLAVSHLLRALDLVRKHNAAPPPPPYAVTRFTP